MLPGSVVVGVDGSPPGEVALDWAAHAADEQRRALTVVHAAGPVTTAETLYDRMEATQACRLAGLDVVGAAVARVRERHPSLRVDSWMPLGAPQRVLRAAAERAHLLVVGAHGRGTLATLLLGSVGGDLAAHAPCPVVVARASGPSRRGVVVGVDGFPSSADAVGLAYDLASWHAEPLEVLHAFDGLGGWTVPDLLSHEQAGALVSATEARVAETLAGYAEKYPDVQVTRRLVPLDAVTALVQASHDASTVVVGSRGRGRTVSAMLGSTSRELLRQARCTVVVAGRHG